MPRDQPSNDGAASGSADAWGDELPDPKDPVLDLQKSDVWLLAGLSLPGWTGLLAGITIVATGLADIPLRALAWMLLHAIAFTGAAYVANVYRRLQQPIEVTNR